jgi:hypothetical protein
MGCLNGEHLSRDPSRTGHIHNRNESFWQGVAFAQLKKARICQKCLKKTRTNKQIYSDYLDFRRGLGSRAPRFATKPLAPEMR